MTRGRVDARLRHIGHHRSDKRVAQAARDGVRVGGNAHIVLAERHVGAVLFRAAGGDDDGGLSGRDGVTHFVPGELFQEDGIGSLRQRRARHQKRREQKHASDHDGLPIVFLVGGSMGRSGQ